MSSRRKRNLQRKRDRAQPRKPLPLGGFDKETRARLLAEPGALELLFCDRCGQFFDEDGEAVCASCRTAPPEE